ncbi:hypothetical protein ACWDXT_20210 [Streptomyces sp. NPDC003236]
MTEPISALRSGDTAAGASRRPIPRPGDEVEGRFQEAGDVVVSAGVDDRAAEPVEGDRRELGRRAACN